MAQKILLIDDDLYLREIYEETLKNAGYEVEICTNGEEGIAKLKEGGYSLCLLDVMLPKIDGIGVLEYLQKHPSLLKNGPIIVFSNLSHESLITDAINKGAESYLIKADMTPEMLLAEVKKYITPKTS